ncbi:hypothetical protein A5784_15110 [Mycobacterium sp. 852013-50091_SCH5140682]|uniref:DUF4190 domain-containing protein n=1 Tax=Mycobacterium sp. 852013-50091_SCH5140682 TaxID=1834109 RepID=UPI0007EB3B7E|nr:DUF4190 domain-containing protein [Mycobacterium sp. 852013-50091_SCH5140682]OBC03229.1 hypothetical protein A5784_15110 [Mycobacterium sp. 852013-50091_SCH5140682]
MTQWGNSWPMDHGAFDPFGQPQQAPPPHDHPGSRWPSISLFVGLAGIALAFFPSGIGFVAVPVGIFGVVAGIVGVQAVQREQRNPVMAISGIVASVLAMVLAVVMFFAFYRSPAPLPAPAGPTLTPTSMSPSGPAEVIPRYNGNTDVVLTKEMVVDFGQYTDAGGDPEVRNPRVEVTITSKRDIPRTCNFRILARGGPQHTTVDEFFVEAAVSAKGTVRQNLFPSDATLTTSKADQLRTASFEVATARCDTY